MYDSFNKNNLLTLAYNLYEAIRNMFCFINYVYDNSPNPNPIGTLTVNTKTSSNPIGGTAFLPARRPSCSRILCASLAPPSPTDLAVSSRSINYNFITLTMVYRHRCSVTLIQIIANGSCSY